MRLDSHVLYNPFIKRNKYEAPASLRLGLLKVELGLEDLAKYPFLKEAGEHVRQQSLGVDDLAQLDYENVLKRAKDRVLEAVKHGRVSDEIREVETDVLSFPVALLMVKATGLEYLASRYSLSEAKRVEAFLNRERMDIIAYIFKTVLNIDLSEVYEGSDYPHYDFKIPVAEYLKRATRFHELEWKLVNRQLERGYVYLRTQDLIRLIREEIRSIIYSKIKALSVPKLPEVVKSIVEELTALTPKPRPISEASSPTPEGYPPCVKHAIEIIHKGQNLPHYGRFLMTSYLLNIGKTVEDIMALYPKAPDFSERVTRYQVEHIAGLKGGRIKYRCPSCRSLQTHSFCFRDDVCDDIKNPLQYGRFTGKRRVERSK